MSSPPTPLPHLQTIPYSTKHVHVVLILSFILTEAKDKDSKKMVQSAQMLFHFGHDVVVADYYH